LLGEYKAKVSCLKNATILREQIEESLSARIPEAFSPRERTQPDRTPCQIAAIDKLLHGGMPAGVLTEFVGEEGSGRTTVALAYVAAFTQAGNVCAWIDVSDALDPETVAANGVDLERLLWVRCGSRPLAPSQAASAFRQNVFPGGRIEASTSQPRHTGGGSPHPRSEGRNMPQAISSLLNAHGGLYDKQLRREKKTIGARGEPNRPPSQRSQDREEQINSDRLPPRRGDNLAIVPRCAEPQPRRIPSQPSVERLSVKPSELFKVETRARSSWQALDQALRATDLLLQGGGFGAIVLDLGSMPPEFVWRVPLATWFRFRAACERTRISLVLLTQHPCARSSAELVVRMATGSMEAQNKVMTGMRYCAVTERSRSHEQNSRVVSIRKPPQSERPGEWRSETAWALVK
jgi:recombination protein RecA